MCGNRKWDVRFGKDNEGLFAKLKDASEKERLWAIAKLEEKCNGHGIPKKFIDSLINILENDESSLVKAMAIRALYHKSSECWPYDKDDRKKVLSAIINYKSGLGMGIDRHIAYEIREIENRMRWLQRWEYTL